MPGRKSLVDLAGAILDGTSIDWASAESRADAQEGALLPQLRLLSALADVHRDQSPSSTAQVDAERSDRRERAQPPERWAHLRVLERIGGGAFGDVYRAWDTTLDREVALKLLRASPATPDATSIIHEGRLLARVRHPNVVTIYGAERSGDLVGLWMELVKGRTVERALEDGTAFSSADAVRIGVDLCRAVSAVHAVGLLHRDIKAHNVVLADDGRVVLMDFGTGRERDDTSAGLAGTPLYLAPELLAGADATVSSDIYSIGVLLYRLLARTYPVRARSLRELRLAHDRGSRIELRTARPDVPARLAGVIGRALHPRPDRRYVSCDALAADLSASIARARVPRAIYACGVAAATLALVWSVWRPGGPLANRHGAAAAPPAALATATNAKPIERPTIVVLPFENLSAGRLSEEFVDGLTDEIIRSLARVRGLEVRSRTSSFAFKGRSRNVRDIGDQLAVNLVVSGSILLAGSTLRVNVQLIPVTTDVPLWVERFERELRDVFAIQDEISRTIVGKLQLTLGSAPRRHETDVVTYELYLQARAAMLRRGSLDARHAVELFNQVIARDASFPAAHAGLAQAYAFLSRDYYGMDWEKARPLMQRAALEAIRLDPMLAEAHAAMGHLHARQRKWENARESFRRAIALDPSSTAVYTSYTFSTLLPLGELEEAERILQAALRIDPLSLIVRRELALLQIVAGRYGEAIDNLRRVYSVDPEFPFAKLHLMRALTFGGRPSEALALYEPHKGQPGHQYWMAHAYVRAGRREPVERMPAAHDRSYPFREFVIQTALGDKDRAFAALARVAETDPQRVGLILVFPETALLRGDPRLAVFRRSFGLPEETFAAPRSR